MTTEVKFEKGRSSTNLRKFETEEELKFAEDIMDHARQWVQSLHWDFGMSVGGAAELLANQSGFTFYHKSRTGIEYKPFKKKA